MSRTHHRKRISFDYWGRRWRNKGMCNCPTKHGVSVKKATVRAERRAAKQKEELE